MCSIQARSPARSSASGELETYGPRDRSRTLCSRRVSRRGPCVRWSYRRSRDEDTFDRAGFMIGPPARPRAWSDDRQGTGRRPSGIPSLGIHLRALPSPKQLCACAPKRFSARKRTGTETLRRTNSRATTSWWTPERVQGPWNTGTRRSVELWVEPSAGCRYRAPFGGYRSSSTALARVPDPQRTRMK